jgi:hypothetical protein
MKRAARFLVPPALAVALLLPLTLTSPAGASAHESFATWSPAFVALELKYGDALLAIGKSASSSETTAFKKGAKTLATYVEKFAALENSPSPAINTNVALLAKQTKKLSAALYGLSIKVTTKGGNEVVSDSAAVKKTSLAIDKQIKEWLKHPGVTT